MTRSFSTSQRNAAYVYQGGKCAICGCELGAGFHMDHITPYSRGGKTDIINGQALCPTCNLKKGSKMNQNVQLREWQERAFRAFLQKPSSDFLQVATPGAGKTVFAMYVARHLFDTGEIKRVVVVVPTNHLRKQWADTAGKLFGLEVQRGFSNQNTVLASDFDGVAVTYQAVAASPEIYRKMSTDRSTLVIFDEIHHAGDAKGWGEAIRHAFAPARRRLSITGTPFRGDKTRIPFVAYDPETGECQPDETYSYQSAMTDGVCREVSFHTFEGQLEWIGRDGDERSASFSDELTTSETSERLRTALSPDTDWLPGVIREADERLRSIREYEFPNAAGLIIAIDRSHALRLARLVEKVTGETPAVAISDNPEQDAENPSHVISRFREASSPRWIVAVKMVSEGVDIPRLCVGVYATNVVSELFFRQAVGRFVRVHPDFKEVGAVVYAPKDPRIVDLIEIVSQEVEAFIQEDRERESRESDHSGEMNDSAFEPTYGQSIADMVYIGDEAFSQEQVNEIRRFISDSEIERVSLEFALKLYRKAYNDIQGQLNSVPQDPTANVSRPEPRERSLEEEKDLLRQRVNKKVRRLVHEYGGDLKIHHGHIHKHLNRATATTSVKTATADQLRQQVEMLPDIESQLEKQREEQREMAEGSK